MYRSKALIFKPELFIFFIINKAAFKTKGLHGERKEVFEHHFANLF